MSSITLPNNRNVFVLAVSLVSAPPVAAAVTVNLSSTFDSVGLTSDGRTFTGGLDGVGFAFSANLLGAVRTFNNMPFTFGPAARPMP
ncbi:MAG: hypothetical protein M3N54_08165 [Acidobacteriota bacterium]|nr:hypothetical protein [Acidobacteriota bacterium]